MSVAVRSSYSSIHGRGAGDSNVYRAAMRAGSVSATGTTITSPTHLKNALLAQRLVWQQNSAAQQSTATAATAANGGGGCDAPASKQVAMHKSLPSAMQQAQHVYQQQKMQQAQATISACLGAAAEGTVAALKREAELASLAAAPLASEEPTPIEVKPVLVDDFGTKASAMTFEMEAQAAAQRVAFAQQEVETVVSAGRRAAEHVAATAGASADEMAFVLGKATSNIAEAVGTAVEAAKSTLSAHVEEQTAIARRTIQEQARAAGFIVTTPEELQQTVRAAVEASLAAMAVTTVAAAPPTVDVAGASAKKWFASFGRRARTTTPDAEAVPEETDEPIGESIDAPVKDGKACEKLEDDEEASICKMRSGGVDEATIVKAVEHVKAGQPVYVYSSPDGSMEIVFTEPPVVTPKDDDDVPEDEAPEDTDSTMPETDTHVEGHNDAMTPDATEVAASADEVKQALVDAETSPSPRAVQMVRLR